MRNKFIVSIVQLLEIACGTVLWRIGVIIVVSFGNCVPEIIYRVLTVYKSESFANFCVCCYFVQSRIKGFELTTACIFFYKFIVRRQ